ncbi:GAF domain containing protein [Pseudomonas chlororaphis]|uniref:GAF domain containing protein n=1 Tax=Pseudomonas chlororaphis TaxID=587753 RepID=A0A3G7TJE6_9PSED|nr:GAF domain-containing protein [Pseudomonas chlororaphis]AZE47215.1 GAF domain containing protein [Pseudomonas chlororaphis]
MRLLVAAQRWTGQVEFGLSNSLGYPVRDADGEVFGTVCALHESARQYSVEEQAVLDALRQKVEALLARSPRWNFSRTGRPQARADEYG